MFEILKGPKLKHLVTGDTEQLYKLLVKLGKHVTLTRKLFEATQHLSSAFAGGFNVLALPSSGSRSVPLVEASINKTLGRMFTDALTKQRFHDKLKLLYKPEKLEEIMENSRKVSTYVHAELLLLDYCHRRGIKFLNSDDRFIGCSKPACYLCHAYIQRHPGNFSVPASHQKLYIRWRLPDESNLNRFILQGLITDVRTQLTSEVHSEAESTLRRQEFRADSTAGATSNAGYFMARWFEQMSLHSPALTTGESATPSLYSGVPL